MYGERHLEGKCYLMTKNSWTELGPSRLKILALALPSPHRISIELSQDRKIQVGRDRENKTLITLTLEITLWAKLCIRNICLFHCSNMALNLVNYGWKCHLQLFLSHSPQKSSSPGNLILSHS